MQEAQSAVTSVNSKVQTVYIHFVA